MNADNKIECDICHSNFNLNKDTVKETSIVITESGVDYPVVMTCLCCPVCGKQYPVIIDDEKTLKLRDKLNSCLKKKMKFYGSHTPVPKKIQDKCKELNKKLDLKRYELAKRFDGAFYQFEGDTIQLDYRYHAR